MKNDSTPVLPSAMKQHQSGRCGRNRSGLAPRRSTILALKQFARVYTCAAALPTAIGGFVAN